MSGFIIVKSESRYAMGTFHDQLVNTSLVANIRPVDLKRQEVCTDTCANTVIILTDGKILYIQESYDLLISVLNPVIVSDTDKHKSETSTKIEP